MSYIKVTNPEAVDVKTNVKGTWYELPAGKEDSFPEDVAHRLVEVYGFLKMGAKLAEAKAAPAPVEEPKEEVKEEEKEEVKETIKSKIAKTVTKK